MATNKEIIQECYAAFGRGDIPGLLGQLDANVEFDYPKANGVPWAGSFRGHDGVVTFFTAIGENSEFLSFEPTAFIEDGNHVVVLGTERRKSKATSKEWSGDWAHAWTLKEGKVMRFREYTDTGAVIEAFS